MNNIQALCVLMFHFTIDTFKNKRRLCVLSLHLLLFQNSCPWSLHIICTVSPPQLGGLVGGIPAVPGALPSFLLYLLL